MPTTLNGDVTLYYETFGADTDPVLLLVNGLGSQCIPSSSPRSPLLRAGRETRRPSGTS